MTPERALYLAALISFVVPAAGLMITWHKAVTTDPLRAITVLLWPAAILGSIASAGSRAMGTRLESASNILAHYGPAAFGVLLVLLALATPSPKRGDPVRPYWRATMAYTAVNVSSAILNGQFVGQASLGRALPVLYLPALVHIVSAVHDGEALLRLARRLSLTVVYASLAAALVYPAWAYLDTAEGVRHVPIGGITLRLAGVGTHPLDLAIVAGLALLLSLRHPRLRMVNMAACVAVIVLAEARSMMAVIAAAVLCYFTFQGRSPAVRFVGASPAIAAVAVALVNSAQATATATPFSTGSDSLNGRTTIWRAALDYYGDHAIFGWGPLAFSELGTPFQLLGFSNGHNQFLQALVEGGALGLLAQIAVTLTMIVIAYHARRHGLFPAAVVLIIATMLTTVPFTLALYGFGFYIATGSILVMVLVAGARIGAADTAEELAEPVKSVPRRGPVLV